MSQNKEDLKNKIIYRASYRGDRIKIVGEFADGNLPINKDGKIRIPKYLEKIFLTKKIMI